MGVIGLVTAGVVSYNNNNDDDNGTPASSTSICSQASGNSFSCDNGCGIGSFAWSTSDSTGTANPLGVNGSQDCSISGNDCHFNNTGLTIFGAVPHVCEVICGSASQLTVNCTNTNTSATCTETCN